MAPAVSHSEASPALNKVNAPALLINSAAVTSNRSGVATRRPGRASEDMNSATAARLSAVTAASMNRYEPGL